jgi:hypothetical protein
VAYLEDKTPRESRDKRRVRRKLSRFEEQSRAIQEDLAPAAPKPSLRAYLRPFQPLLFRMNYA